MGGTETRDGVTFVYDADWNVVSRTKVLGDDVATLGDATSGLASLIDGTADTDDLDFSYYDAAGLIAAIGSAYSTQLAAASVSDAGTLKFDVAWEDSDTYDGGSWSNKEIEIYLPDGSVLGIMHLNSNSWTNTWDADGGEESGEGYNFNDPQWNWLGSGHYNSNGWINENSRTEYAATGDVDDTHGGIAYYTETNKGGRVDSDGNINWENESAWDYSLA